MLATKWHVIKTLDYSKYLHESNKHIQTCCLPKPIRCNVGIIPSSVGIDPVKPFALYSIDTNSFICPSSVGIGPVSSLKPYHNFISYRGFFTMQSILSASCINKISTTWSNRHKVTLSKDLPIFKCFNDSISPNSDGIGPVSTLSPYLFDNDNLKSKTRQR